jgi:hypothetical protein
LEKYRPQRDSPKDISRGRGNKNWQKDWYFKGITKRGIMELFVPTKLKEKVEEWRSNDYACDYPAISEIFDYNIIRTKSETKTLRYLRSAQFQALETYWYLRLVEKTPHIFEFYNRLYRDPVDLLKALGISLSQDDLISLMSRGGIDGVFEKIKKDDEFVKRYKLEAVRETLTLKYPSYILALAMGAGKTVLIGSIIATEFAMAIEYQNDFIKNALVFAPGKTILGALKEISDVPFEKILPPRLYNQFISTVKITYTQDNQKDIPIVRGSSFNIIVTNTEKIRIQKPTRKTFQPLFDLSNRQKEEEQEEIANLRLQTIASLPHLGIFSDEAHHTYGQSLDNELKKVRTTVNYLSENTNVIAVVNTTGTPYYKKQMLKDVIFWYGLSQGIKDGILKDVKNSIFSYDITTSEEFVGTVLDDFFKDYKDVTIFDGAKSKVAIYFPQTEEVDAIKPFVEKRVLSLGLDSSIVFDVNNRSDEQKKDLFNNRVNEIHNPYRVYLLVNMGTEGWNCPSLFATALARNLKSSNNFVLQAASRCLRQTAGNTKQARIYLAKDNVRVLESQLKETFGESLTILNMTNPDLIKEKLVLRKTEIPAVLIKRKIKKIIYDQTKTAAIKICRPDIEDRKITKTIYDAKDAKQGRKILSEQETQQIVLEKSFLDIYEIAIELSAIYRLDIEKTYDILRKVYPEGEIPVSDITSLREQIEKQTRNYKITEEEIEVALALVKPEGFNKERSGRKIIYTTEIIYHKKNQDLLLRYEAFRESNSKDFGFHYSPYKMDSHPEKDFFIKLLEALNEKPDDVDDMYFTGAITDHKKTDFLFEYQDKSGKWRYYTPDFVITKKNGKVLIVEIKGEIFRDETKEMAIREIENVNPDKLKYEVLIAKEEEIGFDNVEKVKHWVYG